MAALDLVFQAMDHVIAQVIETELAVGAVGDVGLVGLHTVHQAHLVLVFVRGFACRVVQESLLAVLGGGGHLQDADRQAEEVVDGAHPAGIPAGQVIIDRHQVDAPAGQRIQIERQGGDQRLAFAGAHLGDLALVQDQPADQLHIVVALADGALGGLPHGGKGFRQEFIQHFLLDLRRSSSSSMPSTSWARRWRNSSVLARRASSLRASNSGSRSLIWSTISVVFSISRLLGSPPKALTNF